MKRWIAAVLVVVGVALGTAACGSDDDGGVIETPTTAPGNSPGTTRGSDYSG